MSAPWDRQYGIVELWILTASSRIQTLVLLSFLPFLRNCIDATSQCFGCICEVLDLWWPKDAPNCFKKEIVRVMKENMNLEQKNITSKNVEVQTDSGELQNMDDSKEALDTTDEQNNNVKTGDDNVSEGRFSIPFIYSLTLLLIIFIISFLFLSITHK